MSQTASEFPRNAALALVTAVLAASLVIALFLMTRFSVAMTLGGIGVVVLFLVSGNQRLFCLWVVVSLAQFALASNFMIVDHMGGAASFTIDAIDPFLLVLVVFILRDAVRGERLALRLSPVAICWGVMVVLGCIDVMLGPLRVLTAQEVLRMVKCYVLFFVVLNEVVRIRLFGHLLVALVAGIMLQSSVAIIQGVFKVSLGLQALGEADFATIKIAARATFLYEPSAGFRASGLIGHPNLLGAYLAMLLPVCIALLFSRISSLAKIALGCTTLVGLAALMLSQSRSGWLSFGVAFMLLFGLSFVHPRLRRRFIFARVMALVMMIVVVGSFSGVIVKRLFESDPGAINFRVEWNQVAWKMVQEKPLLGFGLNTFSKHMAGRTHYGGTVALADVFGRAWPTVHNIYLLTWSEQGTLGFACFVALHLYLLWIGVRNIQRYYNDMLFAVNLGAICGLVAMMIDGMSSFTLRVPAAARMFWIFVAMMVAIDLWNTANAPRGASAPAVANRPVRRIPLAA